MEKNTQIDTSRHFLGENTKNAPKPKDPAKVFIGNQDGTSNKSQQHFAYTFENWPQKCIVKPFNTLLTKCGNYLQLVNVNFD